MSDTAVESIRRHSTFDLVRRSAERFPDRRAIVCGDRTWTYRELVDASWRAAGSLTELGVGRGDCVAVLGRNSDMYLIAWLATQALGAIHVPVNFMLTAREVNYIVEHSGAVVGLADVEFYETLVEACEGTHTRAGVLDDEAAPEGGFSFPSSWVDLSTVDRDRVIRPDAIAQIAYTSGTESAPKGAMLSHEALITQYMSCILAGGYEETDIHLHSLPLYHCAQMHCFAMPGLYLGAQGVIIPGANPDAMVAAIEQFEITSIFAPPTVWIGLLSHPRFTASNLPSLRKGYYGAASMPVQVIRDLLDRMPELRLWNYYGQTEIAPAATCLGPEEQLTRLGSAGRAMINVETRVVDEQMRDVAPGEVGEVVHRSPQVMSGYYRAPDLTEAAFEGGWFHSGDLATRDADGYITIVDRKKDMINTGGENVSSREVEEVLHQHPDVVEVAVIGIPDEKWIEAVCAMVVLREGAETTEDELRAFARERTAPFKVPKVVRFTDSLPKNPSGKILKRELRRVAVTSGA